MTQSKSLCGQYIRSRLKRAGLFNRKLGLQRLRSATDLNAKEVGEVVEVFGQLHAIGLELERLHPKLYTGICRQVLIFFVKALLTFRGSFFVVGLDSRGIRRGFLLHCFSPSFCCHFHLMFFCTYLCGSSPFSLFPCPRFL